jgi:hypothetical protein
MKIEKRTKGLLRFKTTEGIIVLNDGVNELTDKEFKLIKAHPMYEAMVGTSGLHILPEQKKKSKAKAKKIDSKGDSEEVDSKGDSEEVDSKGDSEKVDSKGDSEEVVKQSSEESNSEDAIDLSDIDLESQDKKTLVKIANSLDIETKGLNREEIIEKIKISK